jgi:hypothetical protein
MLKINQKKNKKEKSKLQQESEKYVSKGNAKIGMMVDNILRDSEEINDDDELSGDDVKQPIFMITRNGQNPNNPEQEMETEEQEVEDLMDNQNEQFVQEEYDLA